MSIDPFCLCDEMYRGAATKKHIYTNIYVKAVNQQLETLCPFQCCDVVFSVLQSYNTLVFAVNFAIHCGISSALTFGDLHLYFSCDVVVVWYKTFIYALRTCGLRVGGWECSLL